jgi:Zn-dependent protease
MKSAWQLGQIRGIKVSVHWTFLLLIAWIVFSNVREGRTAIDILWSIGFILSIFVCVVLHEFGHALTAQHYNIKTKDITLYPIGGIARLESMPKKPKEELIVALAGPAVNLVLVMLLILFVNRELLSDPANLAVIGPDNFLLAFVAVNFWLAVFNLIPAFPMDGGRVFRALLSFKLNRAKATQIAAALGQTLAVGFILLGFYGNPFLILIGVFIFLGAKAESNFVQAEALMQGYILNNITMHDMPTLQANTHVSDAVKELLNSQNRNFVIVENETIVGTLNERELIKALQDKSEEQTLVRDIMNEKVLSLPSDMTVQDAWLQMQRDNKSIAIVRNGEQVVGMIDIDNLAEFILVQSARQKFSEIEASNA